MKIYPKLILVIFASIATSQNSPYTIQSLPAYSLQRACVQNCLNGGDDRLPNNIGCPALNACVCRTDLQSQVSTYLTSCVNSACNTNPPDLTSAVGLYDTYCSVNGYSIVGAAVTLTAATSFVTSPATATVIIVPTATVTATATSSLTSLATTISSAESPLQSSSTSISSSSTTSTPTTTSISSTTIPISILTSTPVASTKAGVGAGAIAGGVVGGLAVIGIIVALILFFIHRCRKPKPGPLPETSYYVEQLQPTLYNPLNTASPSPPYVQNTAPYPDVKNGHEIYEAAAAGPSSPAEHSYGAS